MNKPGSSFFIDWTIPVAYAVAYRNYSLLHYYDGRTLLVAYSIRVVTERYLRLLRVRKNTAIDPAYIHHWSRDTATRSARIILRNGTTVHVARRRVEEVVGRLTQNAQNHER